MAETVEPAHLGRVPLCVDLDGTLIRNDTLWVSMACLIRTSPVNLFLIPWWYLRSGRAMMKCQIAERCLPSAQNLPYHKGFMKYLKVQKDRGRRLILVTGAHRLIAEAVSSYTGMFDECIGTVAGLNLSGKAKAEHLVQRFGEQGFDYAGNHHVDLSVWKASRSIIIVNAPPSVRKKAEAIGRTEAIFQ
ncbi:MAG: haloacid dehalogenase-like hydrolase [Verrucomicrobiota bacterium]